MANITDRYESIDYNYPSMKRKDTMYLSTISQQDFAQKKFKQLDTNRDWSVNLYNLDIEGTSPRRIGPFFKKMDYINKIDDIEKTSSTLLHMKLNKPDYNLSNKDIEGASPNCTKFKTTRNYIDPLEPKYQLPKVEEMPPIAPKFIRDNIQVSDIEGTHPRKYLKWHQRKSIETYLEGSSPRKPYIRKTKFDSIDYSDVTQKDMPTNRCVNPLDPVYEVKYKDGENFIYGNIEKSKPAKLYIDILDPKNSLKVDDIAGTQVGSKNRFNRFMGQNLNLKNYDIQGTNSGSLKKGIVTSRRTNPVNPKYEMPGDIELAGNTYENTQCKIGHKNALKSSESSPGMNEQKTPIPKEAIRYPQNVTESEEMKLVSQSQSINPRAGNQVKLSPREVLGLRDEMCLEDRVDFAPDKFKKPDPFFGIVHDKFLISSEATMKGDSEKLKKAFHNTNATGISGGNNPNLKSTNSISNAGQTSITCNTLSSVLFSKPSYAQQLDKFMQDNNLRYQN